MKRSEIKLNDKQRIDYLRQNRRWLGALLGDKRKKNRITTYEANARHLVQTEMIELLLYLQRREMTLSDCYQLIESAQKTSRGWKPANLFDHAD